MSARTYHFLLSEISELTASSRWFSEFLIIVVAVEMAQWLRPFCDLMDILS